MNCATSHLVINSGSFSIKTKFVIAALQKLIKSVDKLFSVFKFDGYVTVHLQSPQRCYCSSYSPTIFSCCEFKIALFVGSHIGTVMGMKVSGNLCHYCGWESVFYVFGKKRTFSLHTCNRCTVITMRCVRPTTNLMHKLMLKMHHS